MARTGASSGVGAKGDNKDEGVITNPGPADKDLGKESGGKASGVSRVFYPRAQAASAIVQGRDPENRHPHTAFHPWLSSHAQDSHWASSPEIRISTGGIDLCTLISLLEQNARWRWVMNASGWTSSASQHWISLCLKFGSWYLLSLFGDGIDRFS